MAWTCAWPSISWDPKSMRDPGLQTQSAITQSITTPNVLVEMGFALPVRFSTVGTVTFGGETFLEAAVEVNWGDDPTVSVFNEATQLAQIVLTEGTAGKRIRIWQYYALDEAELLFDGQMGASRIGERVTIRCRRRGPNRTPRDYVDEPTFTHLLKRGTRFQTPTQTITIE